MKIKELPYSQSLVEWFNKHCSDTLHPMDFDTRDEILEQVENTYNSHRNQPLREIKFKKEGFELLFANGIGSVHPTDSVIAFLGAWYALAYGDSMKTVDEKRDLQQKIAKIIVSYELTGADALTSLSEVLKSTDAKPLENQRQTWPFKPMADTEVNTTAAPCPSCPMAPFPLKDEKGETVITRTAKAINNLTTNPFEVDWESVTLYDNNFTEELLELIDTELLDDVANAILDEEARREQFDAPCFEVSSDYYRRGDGAWYSYRYEVINSGDYLNPVELANSIKEKRQKAEEYAKKAEERRHQKAKKELQKRMGWSSFEMDESIKRLSEPLDFDLEDVKQIACEMAMMKAKSPDEYNHFWKNLQDQMAQEMARKLEQENEQLRKEQEAWRDRPEYKAEIAKYEKAAKQKLSVEQIKEGLKRIIVTYSNRDELCNFIYRLNQILMGTAWDTVSATIVEEMLEVFDNKEYERSQRMSKPMTDSLDKIAERPQMKDNNGIVAGGSVTAQITPTDEQFKSLISHTNPNLLR